MHCRYVLILSLTLAAGSSHAVPPITDRETLCALKYGRFVPSASKKDQFDYAGSTAMEDACKASFKPQRETICAHNYRQREIVAACEDTYDAVTEQIRQASQKPVSR